MIPKKIWGGQLAGVRSPNFEHQKRTLYPLIFTGLFLKQHNVISWRFDETTDALWLVTIAIFGSKVQSLTLDYLKGLLKHYVLLRPIIHSLALSIIRIEFFKNTFHNVQTSALDILDRQGYYYSFSANG